MTPIQLTATQSAVLAHAIRHTDGRIDWFPDSVKGGARKKVFDGLFNRALITPSGNDWLVAAEGYDAIGCARPSTGPAALIPDIEAAVAAAEASWTPQQVIEPATEATTEPAEVPTTHKLRSREHSKQAIVISMLKRPEGATIEQIVAATSWQSHTVRGTFAGAFKKKLGLDITSAKDTGAQRIYRITDSVAAT